MNKVAVEDFVKKLNKWEPLGPNIILRTKDGLEKFRGRVDRKTLVKAASGLLYEISYIATPLNSDYKTIGKPRTVYNDYDFVIDDQIFKSFIDALKSIPLSNFESTTHIILVETSNVHFYDPISGLQERYSDMYYVFRETYDIVTITHDYVIQNQDCVIYDEIEYEYPRSLLEHQFLRYVRENVWKTDYELPLFVPKLPRNNYLSRLLFGCMRI